MLNLNQNEAAIANKIAALKDAAGTHSPSIHSLTKQIPDLSIKIDACFLSNPYATDLFIDHLKDDLINTNKIRDVLEFYPSQNSVIAAKLAAFLKVDKDAIFVGNGAIEVIQAVIHNFSGKKIAVTIPTFSSYYEFAKPDQEVVFYELQKEKDFDLDITDYLRFINESKPNTAVLINPNNPDGGYIKYSDIVMILEDLRHLDNVIIDESFIHFAYEDDAYTLSDYTKLFERYPNLILIKSMSKDFGIAGIRLGYALMEPQKVKALLRSGYLWNSNGLAEYFIDLYTDDDFWEKYRDVRVKYIEHAKKFFSELDQIPEIKAYPTKANFALIELVDGTKASTFWTKMLIKNGIYVRNCSDKIGLDGEFLRIAARTNEENEEIISSIKALY